MCGPVIPFAELHDGPAHMTVIFLEFMVVLQSAGILKSEYIRQDFLKLYMLCHLFLSFNIFKGRTKLFRFSLI